MIAMQSRVQMKKEKENITVLLLCQNRWFASCVLVSASGTDRVGSGSTMRVEMSHQRKERLMINGDVKAIEN